MIEESEGKIMTTPHPTSQNTFVFLYTVGSVQQQQQQQQQQG
jgi:hypothetical protein